MRKRNLHDPQSSTVRTFILANSNTGAGILAQGMTNSPL